jgi:hypothetical protein
MDYLFYHSIQQSRLKNFIISYDIACQWSINLKERMFAFDDEFFLFNGVTQVKFFVPKFHLPAHISACRSKYSFNYGKGVGRTEGEAPERGWSDTNALAPSTREMGPGSRRDTLDYHFGDHNWQKVTGMGRYYRNQRTSDALLTASQKELLSVANYFLRPPTWLNIRLAITNSARHFLRRYWTCGQSKSRLGRMIQPSLTLLKL